MEHAHGGCAYFPWIGTALAVAYAVYITMKSKRDQKSQNDSHINLCVQKECDKVVHSLDIEDLDKKSVFCRCWKSKKFPYCDGTHNKHNEATGDNVGPLILQKKDV